MKRIINLKNLLLGFLPMLCLFACDGDEHYDVVGNEGCIYIREVKGVDKYPVKGDIFTVPSRIFGKAELKFPVRSTMPVKENVEVDFVLDNSLVASYNKIHGTAYAPVDPQYLIIKNLKLTLAEGQTESADSVSIVVPEEHFRTIENGEYLLPVRMEKVTGYLSATSIKENTVMYLIISVIHSDSNLKPDNSSEGNAVSKEECKKWKAEYSAPYKIMDYSDSGVNDINTALFDQNFQTCLFITQDFVAGDYLLVDFGKVYPNISSFYMQYVSSSYVHSQMIFYTSNDKENWEKQGTKQNSSGQMYCSFYAPVEARYVKIEGVSIPYPGPNLQLSDFNIYLK